MDHSQWMVRGNHLPLWKIKSLISLFSPSVAGEGQIIYNQVKIVWHVKMSQTASFQFL